jgi:hypothetical protein
MRSPIFVCVLSLVACGNDSVDPSPDGPAGNRPDPRVIAGGGIGDGAIDGVVNLYVIDDATRTPIANAEVRVGTVTGTTDATGLFVAEDVVGKQDVVIKAAGHRSEIWIGANGANMTVNMAVANQPTPASTNLSGTITGWTGIAVAAGHAKQAVVVYSQTDDLGDPANELEQTTPGQNGCITTLPADLCNFTVTTRTGKVGLIAAIIDRDLNGTPANGDDDILTLIGWAVRQGITVTADANQSGMDLAILPAAMQETVTVDFGAPPASLTQRVALVGIDLGDEGVFQLPIPVFATPNTLLAPKLAGIAGGTGFRLTAIASDGAPTDTTQSIVLRRALTGPTLAAGTWLAPPTAVTLSRTGGTWSNAAEATLHGVELRQGATAVLNVSALDGSTTFTLPDLIALPSGEITAAVNAIGATGLDVTDFSLDADRNKLDRVAGQATTID